MNGRTLSWAFAAATAAFCAMTLAPGLARAQDGHETDPAAALSSALAAACRANQTQFAVYLTADSAVAFRGLPEDQRTQFVKRFSLSDSPGRPLLSSDAQNHVVLRCETPDTTIEFRQGNTRLRENLAFVPITVVGGENTEFGMVREGGGWKLLSLGLVLIDVPQLAKQWAKQDLDEREAEAVETLRGVADAVDTYRRAFGKLPDSLGQLGPSPPGEVSPERASLLNEHVSAGEQGGYHFRYRIASGSDQSNGGFELVATPDEYGKTGRRSFFYDSVGKIHAADKQGAMASVADPVLADEKTQ